LIPNMADNIIDITRYMKREPVSEVPRGAMALWGAEGERSKFALPLWRILHLADAERALILSCDVEGVGESLPFVVLDTGQEPARIEVDETQIPRFAVDDPPSLLDRADAGLVIHLGSQGGRNWTLVVDCGPTRAQPLPTGVREEIAFLSGECAGLLALRDAVI
jgi:hypothetical protein